MFRYKVEVEGTDIREFYEFEDNKSKAEVANIWYADVKKRWGEVIAHKFKDGLTVEKITPERTALPEE